jgi:hypothetical protein
MRNGAECDWLVSACYIERKGGEEGEPHSEKRRRLWSLERKGPQDGWRDRTRRKLISLRFARSFPAI